MYRFVWFSLLLWIIVGGVGRQGSHGAAHAQPVGFSHPVGFGSALTPVERSGLQSPGLPAYVLLSGGPAYINDGWRGGLRGEMEAQVDRVSLGLSGTLHPTASRLFSHEEVDPLYDAVRTLRYLRWNPTASSSTYARLGPLDHVTLGAGHLVRRYRTTAAWEERTVGAEAATRFGAVSAAAFLGDVRGGGAAGAQMEIQTDLDVGPVRNIRLHLGAARTALTGTASLIGTEAMLSGDVFRESDLALSPFVSLARWVGRGAGIGLGVNLEADNLANTVGGRLRAALFLSSDGFAPSHVGPLAQVSVGGARVVRPESFYDTDGPATLDLAGTPLHDVRAGADLVLEADLLRFGLLSVGSHLRRHIGRDRRSTFGVYTLLQTPGGTRFQFDVERHGFRSMFDLFGDMEPLSTLTLDVTIPLRQDLVVDLRSRYGYRRLRSAEAETESPRFLAERRFEPFGGLRITL